MNRILETHKEFEIMDYKILQKAKRLKAPCTEKIYKKEDMLEIKLQIDDNFEDIPINKLLQRRKSIRDYVENSINFSQLSNILHYSYGIKEFRNNAYNRKKYPVSFSPSAGGLQPFNIYVYVSNVEGIQAGLYYYSPLKDSLLQLYNGRPEIDLSECYVSEFPIYAPVNIILVSDINRFEWKYGYRGYRLMNVDCGILAENISLLAVAQNIGSCMVAAFSNDKVSEMLNLSETEIPILCMTVGKANE